jgi:heat shock protein HtpX
MNGIKTALLLGLLSALLLVGGQAIGGQQGLIIALVLAAVMNFASYFFAEKIALSMYKAQPVTPDQNSHIYGRVYPLVANLSMRMGIPMPKLWVIPGMSPNAFATGRNPSHASVAFTEGILELMDDREVEGVIAHELGHIKNHDILIASVAATIAAAITYLSHFAFFFGGRSDDEDEGGGIFGMLLMMILAPIAAMLIQMAISRNREFAADAAAAEYTGHPDGLVNALRKLEYGSKRLPMHADPSTAHMFIVKPFTGSAMRNLFSTHPATEQRIARLEAMR